MDDRSLALNETMQIHELLNFKTIFMTTSKLMEGVVFDQDLKKLLEKSVRLSMSDITGLQALLKRDSEVKV